MNKPATLIIPVDEELHLRTEDGQVVVSSRYIAERFGKQHKDVLESIRNLEAQMSIAEFSALFISSAYKALNGKINPQVLMNRDGFTLLAMGFTGKEALHWKLKYIEAFNKMEAELKKQQSPMSMEDIIIYQMQQSKAMKEQLDHTQAVAIEAKAKTEELGHKVDSIKDVIALDSTSWRDDTKDLINRIATFRGGTQNIFQETRREAYESLTKRMGVNLEQRLTNKRRRMADEGICKSKRDKLTKIDVIADDKKLIEGYVAIVKEMAIRYGCC